jgi:hypothetical protein
MHGGSVSLTGSFVLVLVVVLVLGFCGTECWSTGVLDYRARSSLTFHFSPSLPSRPG